MRTHNLRTTPTRLWAIALAFILIITLFGSPVKTAFAAETLSITPITWNVIGLDSNNPASGPNRFPVGARICNEGTTDALNVSSTFYWDSTDPYIDLSPSSISAFTGELATPILAAGECVDHYYEATVTRTKDAYDHTRAYHITADSDNFASVSTPANRELLIEHLVSQNRNSTTSLWMGETEASMTEITLGGSIDLVVGQDYYMLLNAQTAPGGYNNAETFVSLSNTVFRINSVQATYTQTDPKIDLSLLYADSCGWDNDSTSPTYRSCIVDDGKTGGTLSILYHLTVIDTADSSAALNTLIYDFSGSSYHYNSDFSSPTVIFNTITETNFSKSFSPASIFSGDVSTLTFDIENVTASTITNVSFTDDLPVGLTVASPANETLSPECLGTPTTSASGSAISVSGLEIAGGTTCQYSVDVTSASADKYNNISANLFLDGFDTGTNATADLIVADAVAGTGCTTSTLAEYQFATLANGGSLTNPTPTSYALPSQPTAALGAGLKVYSADPTQDHTVSPAGTVAWGSQGTNSGFTQKGALDITQQTYFEFILDTTDLESFSVSYYAAALNGGPTVATLYTFPEGEAAADNTALYTSSITAVSGGGVWTNGTYTYDLSKATPDVNLSGNTVVRIYVSEAGADNAGVGDGFLDDVVFTGCGVLQPSLTKAFDPELVKQGDSSTLTLTLTNPNGYDLTGATFSDELPTGVEATSFNTTCVGGDLSTSTASTITLTGATVPASSSCTVTVGTTVTGNGALDNLSGPLTTTETGTATTPPATATVTAGVDPLFSKQFIPDSIYEGESTILRFTISNPNELDLTGVAFDDVLPSGLLLTADSPTNSCGGTLTAVVDTDTISLTGGSILAKDECVIEVGVTGDTSGTYTNTTGNLTTDQNTDPVSATDDLAIRAVTPAIALLKQVSDSASGPWGSFVSVDPAASGDVYYRFTIENIGDTDLSDVALSDPTIDLSTCALAAPFTLTTADPIQTCVVGPISAEYGSNPNTASVSGTYGAEMVTDESNASYLGFTPSDGPSLQLLKQVSKSAIGPWSSLIDGVLPGDDVYYRFLVTNDGNSAVSLSTLSDDLLSGVDLTTCELNTTLAAGSSTTCVYGPVTSVEGITVNTATVGYTDGVTDYTDDSNAAVYPAGTADIGGTVWQDPDRDVVIDAGENGLPNELVQLYQDVNDDGVIDNGDILIGQKFTDADGAYLFSNLPISNGTTYNYLVVVTDPSSLEFVGSNKTSATQGSQQVIDLRAFSADSLDNNFAYAPPITDTFDLSIEKSDGLSQVEYGAATTYTILVTNTGTGSISGAVVTDPAIDGFTKTNTACSATPGVCASAPSIAELEGAGAVLPDLVSGATYEFTITGTVSATTGDLINIAVVSMPEGITDETPGDNTDGDSNEVLYFGLSLNKYVTTNTYSVVDQLVTYYYTLTNESNVAIYAPFTISDDKFVDDLVCAAPGDMLAVGASVTCEQDHVVTADDITAGSITNTAQATAYNAQTGGSALVSNIDSVTITYEETTVYDLKIVKSDGVSQIDHGDTVTYTIKVSNKGTGTISGAVVSDPAVDGLSKISTSCSGTPGVCLSAPSIAALEGAGATLPDLAVGEYYEFTVSATVTASTGDIINTAIVSMPEGFTDEDPSDNFDTDTDEVLYYGLSLNKFVVGSTFSNAGQVVTYHYTLTNESNTALYAPFTISDDKFGADLVCTAADGMISVGEVLLCEQDYTIASADVTAGSVTNTAQATAYDAQSGGSAVTSNIDSVTITYVEPTPEPEPTPTDGSASLNKQVSVDGSNWYNSISVDAGTTVRYRIQVRNTGSVALTNVVVNDNMSACALSQPVGDLDADGALDTNETWTYTCQLAAEVGLHTNVATVNAPQLSEPLSDNATYTGVVVNVFDPPSVIKYMTSAGLPEVETRMVWINNGNTTAINVQVTDAIPAGSVYVPGSLTCAPFGASVTAPSASAPLSATAVPSSACGYDSALNRIQWQGNIAPDYGVTSEQYANNKVVITFRVSLLPQTNAILNVAHGLVDADNDGSFSDEDQTPASSVDSSAIPFSRFQGHTLPVTGFDPSVITKLPEQPAEMNYADMGMVLEIPSLNVMAPIVIIPQGAETWDVTWLGDSMIGWLDGTAFPTHEGNTVLTGHVLDEKNDPGPFNRIKDLNEGDSFYIHAWGSVYEYQVRKNKLHLATTEVEKVFKEAEGDWVTLVTCEIWNPFTRNFVSRRVVSAELVGVK